jgi:DNA-directed RNA polymerase subunit RPC12/RpoP
MKRFYVCPRCGKLTHHYLDGETQYTQYIVRRFWKCNLCSNLSDIEEIDMLNK